MLAETFVTMRKANLWKILALDLLGPRDNFLSLAKKLSNKPSGPSKKVSWPFLCSIKWEKIG